MEVTFCELKSKDVINVSDGTNLGNITDITIDTICGKVLGISVPNGKSFLGIFKSGNDIFIPYNRICKIGKDIILVDIIMQSNCLKDIAYLKSQNLQPDNHINIKSILDENTNSKNSR